MQLTRMLTKKLISFWMMSLAAVAFVFLLSALMSFVQLTYRFQQQKVAELETMLVNHYQHQSSWDLDTWLPPMLLAYNAVSFRLTQGDELVFEYQGNLGSDQRVLYERTLYGNDAIQMRLELPRPFSAHRLGWRELMILLVGIVAVAGFVRFGFLWFSAELEGIEALAQRSKLILDGKLDEAAKTPGNGKPRLINRALSRLLAELADAHKERARFDKFIRSNTFLDPQTRIGNRLFLQNRLNALSSDQGMLAPGVLYLLEMEDLDILQQEAGDEVVLELLHSTINAINLVLQTQANSIFARRSHNQLAIVVPQISLVEADALADKLLKICLAQPLPKIEEADNFFHLGGAYFKEGDMPEPLLDEADMALRAAQLQGASGWFMYDKGAVDQEFAKGSVRWRSFLENALVNRNFVTFTQPVCEGDGSQHHHEIFTRVRDPMGSLVRATLFIPMAVKCGLMPQIERQVVERTLFELMSDTGNATRHYSINLSVDSLTSRAFVRWLQTTLLEYRHLASRLVFEVTEDMVMKHRSQLESKLNMLRKMGSRICVDHVGQQVVSTQYIRELGFNFIKLHRSVVRQIDLRPENQLFVRSLIGSLYRTDVQVFAEGVGSFEEWQTLLILGVSAGQGSYFGDPQQT
ncbi:RNase E specificity factor CsrD [Shewanella litorisediminis]|uniref:RNase E specificity factor CsrD n=1 Tax=Shewanella litorisediminis TaxID=1173586 RepID=A0ABX7G4J0_9GAMM|nr:RNase E specificity factor CsrD [Shewanella litorisediminis]MCL2917807.1 RNase E specificity factor CsrD [Shewanella litorisediminis]QRH02249.1 RNase E specificity factor CsrD [Shewanella litorisediminis]